jgi:FkbM family methyltransferase
MSSVRQQFIHKLSSLIASSSENDFRDNFDHVRFSGGEKQIVNRSVNIEYVLANIDAFADAYSVFSDDDSRDLYVRLTAFAMFGHRKVKLPLSNAKYFETREKLISLVQRGSDVIDSGLFDWKLYFADLRFIDIPITLYTRASTVLVDYIVRQYEYRSRAVCIGVKPGDTVIDAGACWGNTALCFAHGVGEEGEVYSFEFTKNTEVFKKNMALNPTLAQRINLIEKAVWSNSHDTLYFEGSSPGTKVKEHEIKDGFSVPAISIDDFVREKNISKVDFIKMDIEGAEQSALRGAKKTLEKDKPRLAITIYHGLGDYVAIPRMLRDLDLGYKFYLGHYTIYNEETVLFAEA